MIAKHYKAECSVIIAIVDVSVYTDTADIFMLLPVPQAITFAVFLIPNFWSIQYYTGFPCIMKILESGKAFEFLGK